MYTESDDFSQYQFVDGEFHVNLRLLLWTSYKSEIYTDVSPYQSIIPGSKKNKVDLLRRTSETNRTFLPRSLTPQQWYVMRDVDKSRLRFHTEKCRFSTNISVVELVKRNKQSSHLEQVHEDQHLPS